jgi:phosphoglycerate dehydrogenase-like enzyme
MKVACSPDVHESVQWAVKNHPSVKEFVIIDYEDRTSLIKHYDIQILIAKKEYPFIDALKQLKLFKVATAGYDKVNVLNLWNKNIAVCNNGGANADAVAELTITSVVSCLRNIHYQHQSVIENRWKCLKHSTDELSHQTLGIIGLGKIGMRVANLAKNFGCNILAYDISYDIKNDLEKSHIHFTDMDSLLSESDIVSLHVPLTERTRNMINSSFLSKLKRNAILVNMARGELQNELAIIEALEIGALSAVILDVFSKEPYYNRSLFKYSDPKYTGRGSIFLPHTGPSKRTNENLIKIIIRNIELVASDRCSELEQVVMYE